MNKKGFTLIEILAVIVIMGIITVSGISGITKMAKKSNEKRYDAFVKQIEDASSTYANLNNLREQCGNYNCILEITISDLIEAGLIKENLIDPSTNEVVEEDHVIRVMWQEKEKRIEYTKEGARTFAKVILRNAGGKAAIEAKGVPDFTKTATTNEGMYAAPDDYGTSYYFRGAVDNNWLAMGSENYQNPVYWRIVRINGDGSVRLVYGGNNAPNESEKVTMTGDKTQVGISAFNSNYNSAEYLGYMYTLGEHRGHSESSTIKTNLDNWYIYSLHYHVATGEVAFCNDRSFIIENWTPVGLAPSGRVISSDVYNRTRISSVPKLTCSNQEDIYTYRYNYSELIKGNNQLAYSVGLLTADEVIMAGASAGQGNNSFYLYTNRSYWTMSPANVGPEHAYGLYVHSSGSLYNVHPGNEFGIRPVIAVSGTTYVNGSGTWDDPYYFDIAV